MYIGAAADAHPDKPALIFADQGITVTYRELDERSSRIAHAFRDFGLRPGDGIAVLLGNEEHFFDYYWAAMRSGLYFTPLNWHLAPDEIRYIVDNSDARVLIANASFAGPLAAVAADVPKVERKLAVGGAIAGFERQEPALAGYPTTRPADEREGSHMLYSSGTTGRPKGVRNPLRLDPPGEGAAQLLTVGFCSFFGFDGDDVYLCPGPLYHAAPLQFTQLQHRIGATACVLDRFEPERALAAMERFGVTTSQWVPTHFSRMLALPEVVKKKYDLSRLKIAIHAAAPCPIP